MTLPASVSKHNGDRGAGTPGIALLVRFFGSETMKNRHFNESCIHKYLHLVHNFPFQACKKEFMSHLRLRIRENTLPLKISTKHQLQQ